MSDDEEDSGPRRKPFKPEYAFGTPIRQNIAFSDFAHLGPGMVEFAKDLAAHTDGGELAKKPDPPKKKKPARRDKKPPPGIRPSSKAANRGGSGADIPGMDAAAGRDVFEPCDRPECKDVIQKIIDTQLNNEIEREEIVRLCEEAVLETEQVEEECKELEEKTKAINNEGATLEESLQQLMDKLQKYEKRLSVQIQEKDELNNKAMALEMERQRLSRRSKEVEAALSDALWSGKTTVAVAEKKAASMRIDHSDAALLDPLNSSVSYDSLVRVDVLDFTERPKSVSAVPHYLLYNKQTMAPVTAVVSTDYEAFGETSGIGHSRVTRKSSPSSISRVKTLPSLHGDERSARSKGTHKNRSDNTSVTSNSSWQQLDPVLYQERARTSWGREKKLGEIRTRHDPPGYKRALLTSKGHPGIFNMEPVAEEERASNMLGRTV